MKWRIWMLTIGLALCTGCSGGRNGSGGGGINTGGGSNNYLSGYFKDAAVEGLEYITTTQSGRTDASGAFRYRAGEVVSFYVGDILVGQAEGKSEITPFDLAGATPPQTNLEIVRVVNRFRSGNPIIPMTVVANIAVFLQTLDEDGDPSNGIRIPGRVHELATNMDIDFFQSTLDFREDSQFRKLMWAARRAGLWGGERAIRNSLYALNSLYDGLGLTRQIIAPATFEYDSDADGIVDSITTCIYDAAGNPTAYETDSNIDGTVDSRHSYAHDANGNQTLYERDDDGDGIADYREINIYDANGNCTLYERDDDGDGTADYRETSDYDAGGNLITHEKDGDYDVTAQYYYLHVRQIHVYDSEGNRTASEYDYDVDGAMDSRVHYTYGAGGRLIEEAYDRGIDGTVDSRTTYAYDDRGNLTLAETDDGANGTVDSRRSDAYDANGNRTSIEQDNDGDGIVDYREAFTYDADGNQTSVERDDEGNGIVDYRQTSVYDTNGNRTQITYEHIPDWNPNSTFAYTYRYTYDTEGNQTAVETDYDDDGTIDARSNVTSYHAINLWADFRD